MLGYIKNRNRVLNEWYQLFQNKHGFISVKDRKHWENVMKPDLLHKKNEPWNKCILQEFFKHHFIINESTDFDTSKYNILGLLMDCYKLVFINGQFSSKLSDTQLDPWVLNFNNRSNYDYVANSIHPTIFSYLTECLSNFIVHIKLPTKKISSKPLYILYINSGPNIPNHLTTSHYNHYLELHHDTRASVIEHFISINENSYFTGSRMIMSIGDRSQLEHTKLIFENQATYHISHQDIQLHKSSHINSNTFVILGPKFTYHQINSKINSNHSCLSLNSLSILSKKDISNIKTYTEHLNTNYSMSRQLHKIIAKNHSTGIFKGLIKVGQKSSKTDGKMINNNLLLDKSASIYSIPQLEIYSDSVQCSHGSTIGYINDDNLFYLSSRGITKKDALNMLIHAFALEITKKIQDIPVQTMIINRIDQSLTGI